MRKHRSQSSLKQSIRRRKSWIQWRASKYEREPVDKLWLLHRLVTLVSSLGTGFAVTLASSEVYRTPGSTRVRDIFPLIRLEGSTVKPANFTFQRWYVLKFIGNAVIDSLNWLYGVRPSCPRPQRASSLQLSVHHRLIENLCDFIRRLQDGGDLEWQDFLPDFAKASFKVEIPTLRPLVANLVDTLPASGLFDPMRCLPQHVQKTLADPALLFESAPAGLSNFDSFSSGSRDEYILLVVRQLRSKKLGLVHHALGGGTVFTIGKAGSEKLREIWHGRAVSSAASRPLRPRHLASPTALTALECPRDGKIYVSKRDARCWFDQLLLHPSLRPYMGRPRITAKELYDAGASANELETFLELGEQNSWKSYMPVSRVWPMGFAWSSYVAQESLLWLCGQADLQENMVLSCDQETPLDLGLVFAAATDDLMIFSNEKGITASAAEKFDDTLSMYGVERNQRKDINDSTDCTCIGVNLEDGTHLAVPPARCIAMVMAVLLLLAHPYASPLEVAQLLGSLQWYCLLHRPLLSILDAVYKFTKTVPGSVRREVPNKVLVELAAVVLLGIYWRFDLRREHLPMLSATDASTSFGFGASIIRVPRPFVRRLAKLSEKQGGFIIFDGGSMQGPAAQSFGQRYKLNISSTEFIDVLSVRAKHKAHINVLEGAGFVLWLRWLLRCRSHHCARVVVLVDSAVWLGAACKGRSSSQLNRLLRRVAALTLAGGIVLNIIFVPSSENPSDLASRGIRKKRAPPSTRLSAKDLHAPPQSNASSYSSPRHSTGSGYLGDGSDCL